MTTTILDEQFDPTLVGESFDAPAAAFEFAAKELELDGEQNETSKRGRMLARTGDALNHWYWGRIVHDLNGMSARDRVSLDWCHTSELVGYGENLDTSSGNLWLDVSIESIESGDEADKIIKRSARGVPYEASIQFDAENNFELEYLPDGMSAKVNGRDFVGPLVIARSWNLRRIAVCPSGYDSGTTTNLAKHSAADAARFSVIVKGDTMPKTAKQAAAETESNAELSAADSIEASAATDVANSTTGSESAAADFSAMLEQYCGQFGNEKGAEYLRDGLSFEDALAKSNAELRSELEASQAETAAAKSKLSQIDLGEPKAVESGLFSGAESKGGPNGKGDWASNFAAAQATAAS